MLCAATPANIARARSLSNTCVARPCAERIAWRIGAIAYPSDRGLHTDPTPKLGGLAIFLGIFLAER